MAIDTYLDNVTSQHRDKPKFITWLTAALNKVDDIYLCVENFNNDFDIDKAVGVQQDILGELVGVSRILELETDTISPVLDDETYRLVQKAKVAKNNWDGSIPKIYELWDNMFDNLKLQIIDNEDMSMTAVIFGSIKELNQLLIANGYIVPKPSTVHLNYIGKSDVDFKVYSSMLLCTKTIATIDMIQPPKKPIDLNLYSSMIMTSRVSSTIKMEKSPIPNIGMKGYSKIVVSSTSTNTLDTRRK